MIRVQYFRVERTVLDRYPKLVGLERERHGCIGIAGRLEDRALDGRERARLALAERATLRCQDYHVAGARATAKTKPPAVRRAAGFGKF